MAERKVTVQLVVKPPNLGEVQRSLQGQTASSIGSQFNTQKVFGGGAAAAPKAAPVYNAAQFGGAAGTPPVPKLGLPQPAGAAPGAAAGGGAAGGGGGFGVKLAGAAASGGVGGAVGVLAAAAGPAGIAITAGLAIKKQVDEIAHGLGAAPFTATAKGIGLVNSALAGLQGGLGPIDVGFNALEGGLKFTAEGVKKLTSGLPIAGPLLGGMADGIVGLVGPVHQLTQTMLSLGKAANPAAGKQFDYAVQDSAAVMGRVFVPVLRLATDGVRFFGDVLASVLPNTAEVQAALNPLKSVMGDLRDAAADVTPIIRNSLLTAVQLLGEFLKNLATNFGILYRSARVLLGLSPTSGKGLASSQDASASQASFHGFEEFAKQNQLRAYSQGTQNVTPSEGYLKEIRDFMKLILDPTMAGSAAIVGISTINWAEVIKNGIDPAGLSAQLATAIKNAVKPWGKS